MYKSNHRFQADNSYAATDSSTMQPSILAKPQAYQHAAQSSVERTASYEHERLGSSYGKLYSLEMTM